MKILVSSVPPHPQCLSLLGLYLFFWNWLGLSEEFSVITGFLDMFFILIKNVSSILPIKYDVDSRFKIDSRSKECTSVLTY